MDGNTSLPGKDAHVGGRYRSRGEKARTRFAAAVGIRLKQNRRNDVCGVGSVEGGRSCWRMRARVKRERERGKSDDVPTKQIYWQNAHEQTIDVCRNKWFYCELSGRTSAKYYARLHKDASDWGAVELMDKAFLSFV